MAAREVADAAAARSGGVKKGPSTATDDPDGDQSVFRIYPHELDCDALEEVIASLALEDRVSLTDQLEDASAVLAVKARVKGATWLRHAARARGMPIYALKVEGMPQLARAVQAMLGLNGLNKSADDRDADAADASMAAVSSAQGTDRDASSVTPADEIDALEEVRMAVEQLVIPHQEPVELLPRGREAAQDAGGPHHGGVQASARGVRRGKLEEDQDPSHLHRQLSVVDEAHTARASPSA